jgi:hypothetical protein
MKDHPRSTEPTTTQREKGAEQERELIRRKQREQDWGERKQASGTTLEKKR